jgi:PAS domain S-box-containing protein
MTTAHLRTVEGLAAAAASLVGAAALLGWALDVPALQGVLPGTAAVKAAALCFLLAGAALWVGSARGSSQRAGRQPAEAARRNAAAIVESTDDAVMTRTLEGLVTSWNPAAERIFGYAAQEAIGRSVLMLIPPERAQEEEEILGRIRRGERVEPLETVRIGQDGRRIDVFVTVSPLKDDAGRIVGVSQILRDVTGRKAAAEALQQLGARLTTTLENMSDAFFTVDREWRFTYLNKQCERLLQRTRDELLGKVLWEEFKEAVGGPSDRSYHQAMSENRAIAFEEFYPPLGVWFEVTAHPTIEGLAVYFHDVTGRKVAVESLRDSEERFSAAFQSSPAALAINRRRDQVTLEVNDAFLRLFELTPQEAIGHTLAELGVLDEASVQSLRQELADTGSVNNAEMAARTRTGKPLTISLSVRVVQVGGEPCAVSIILDVTERRRAERWQAMQRAVTQVLADSTSLAAAAPGIIEAVCETLGGRFGGIWEIDREGTALRCADVWHAPGLSAPELEAETRRSSFARGEGLPGRVWACAQPLVMLLAHDAGLPRSVLAASAGLRGALGFPILLQGEVAGVIDFLGPEMREPEPELLAMLSAIGSQIGQFVEHRRADHQLLQAQKMEAVGQLAGGIAHDFNNLLSVILGYGELAARELGPEHRTSRRLEAIRQAAERAAGLTRQILTFSRKQPVESRICDLNHIVQEMEKMLRRLIGEDVRLTVALGEGLGRVRADPGQLEQVIMNLAVNARDAMPAGGRLVIETSNVDLDETHARTHPDVRPGPYVMLTVEDTGAGMAPETVVRIFEPFFTTKEQGKGTGLGLAVVYGIVKQAGGSLSVYSEPGLGSTFRVYLPRTEAPESKEPVSAPAAAAGGSELVLVLEDEESLRAIVAETLRIAGYTVLEASDPREAVALVAQSPRPIQLLISDVVLPGQSGPETASQIRKAQPGVRVLLMSGYTDRLLDANASIDPGTPFLGKPFTIDALLHKVRAVLDQGEPGPREG